MKLEVYNLSNEVVGEIEVSDDVFGAEVKPHLFHEVVRMQRANKRKGTHKQKNRSEARGGGAKPWRQKGTGRARHGSIRSPLWVGGGRAFPKRPRDYGFKLNKKKKRAALRSALSMLVAEGKLKVVDTFELPEIKTRVAKSALDRLGTEKAIVVDGTATDNPFRFDNNETLRLSVRNLPTIKYLRPEGVNVYDVLRFKSAVVTQEALKALEARLNR